MKSPREQGVGFGQITRAYRSDGSIRFDTLADLRNKYKAELYELNWGNIKQRPDLQLRALVLLMRDNYQYYYKYTNDPLAFADAAYNGGIRDLNTERRACVMAKNCDPKLWFGHVENLCMKSKVALYGHRNACDINREHVHMVLKVRSSKYSKFWP